MPGLQVHFERLAGQQRRCRCAASRRSSPGSTVGTYVDETPLGSSGLYQRATLFALDLLPYDVEQHRSAARPAGHAVRRGRDGRPDQVRDDDAGPDADYEFRVGVGMSDVDRARTTRRANYRVGVNVPLVQDSFALRASYATNDSRRLRRQRPDGRRRHQRRRAGPARAPRHAVAAQRRYQRRSCPRMTQTIDSDNNASVALDPRPAAAHRGPANLLSRRRAVQEGNRQLRGDRDWDLGFGRLRLGDRATPTSARDQRSDADFRPSAASRAPRRPAPPGIVVLRPRTATSTSSRRNSACSRRAERPFEWLLGAFYTDEDADNHQFIR